MLEYYPSLTEIIQFLIFVFLFCSPFIIQFFKDFFYDRLYDRTKSWQSIQVPADPYGMLVDIEHEYGEWLTANVGRRGWSWNYQLVQDRNAAIYLQIFCKDANWLPFLKLKWGIDND